VSWSLHDPRSPERIVHPYRGTTGAVLA
jgi:hypothetical protein